VALGTAVIRTVPELNDETGLDNTWNALEIAALSRLHHTLFAIIKKKVRRQNVPAPARARASVLTHRSTRTKTHGWRQRRSGCCHSLSRGS
jgi:hypothetical protein